MATEPRRARARRIAVALAISIVGIALAPIVAAPGVPATCTKILELAALAGEAVGPEAREACEAHYGRLRASRGVLRWSWLSWCTRMAQSIPEAGEC